MNSTTRTSCLSSIRRPWVAAVLLAAPLLSPAAFSAPPSDRAAVLLERHGRVPIAQADGGIHLGAFRSDVRLRLGRPHATLPDGSWHYDRRHVAGSRARGTLVVRFIDGRVADLALIRSAHALALRLPPSAARRDPTGLAAE